MSRWRGFVNCRPGTVRHLLPAACWFACAINGCTNGSPAQDESRHDAGAGGTGSTSPATGGVGATAGVCSAPGTRTERHVGNLDYESCTKCHADTDVYGWGGWVYNNAVGDDWVAGATVTIINDDGTKLTAITEEFGFFTFQKTNDAGTIGSKYTACVSKCPYTLCSTTAHTSPDCQTSNCHGAKNLLIYLPQDSPTQGTGGTGGTTNCLPPASGGPRVHAAKDYDSSDKDCRWCHPMTYTGGYVYDGVTSNNVVSKATVTIKPATGNQITAVSGPGGMIFLGQYDASGTKTVPLTAPYTACVSKCPDTACSDAGTHTNTDDCSTCHNDQLRIHLN
jgi:hypothetical protein